MSCVCPKCGRPCECGDIFCALCELEILGEAQRRSLQVKIPALPPKECSPNWRGHWSQKARAFKEFKQLAYLCALEAKPKGEYWRACSSNVSPG